jgi:cytochrome P450
MKHLFSDETRRNPFPAYEQMRRTSPVLHLPPPFDIWLVFDYEGVKRVVSDAETFSSAVPAPREWFIFWDPPRHTKRRALIAKAFTPRMVVNLEPRIRMLSRQFLDANIGRGEMDLVDDYAVPLPMNVIAGMIGIPTEEWATFKRWSDAILRISFTMPGLQADEENARAMEGFYAVTIEMRSYLADLIEQRRREPRDDLLTGLVRAEVEGDRLTHEEILGFMQLLMVGGQETTTHLITNAVLCLIDNPEQLARLRADMALLPSAIEEVLRYLSPLQWTMRTPRREVELHGRTIPPGKLVLPMIGSANRDPAHFAAADRFDIARDPNSHLAFGHGIHFCLGAALSRLEARIALTDLLNRLGDIRLASDEPWDPRKALNVLGPARLPIQFELGSSKHR